MMSRPSSPPAHPMLMRRAPKALRPPIPSSTWSAPSSSVPGPTPALTPTSDHSTLSRFHAWLTIHAPDALFRDVLTFLDQVDPEDIVGTPQIVDTFAMASPAAPASSPAMLLRQITLRLVDAWWAAAPPRLQPAIPPLDLGPLVHVRRWRSAA